MKILYLSHSRLNNFANSIYLKGLPEIDVGVEAYHIKKSLAGYFDVLKKILKIKADLIMIGYDSSQLVFFCRLFTRKKIVYHAVLPVYERLITSRNLADRRSFKGIYYWLIDFFAFQTADLTMLETDHQIDFVSDFYTVAKERLFRAWTGVDGDDFFYDSSVSKLPVFTVLFRGAFMPEAGVEYALQAAKILENKNVYFVVIGGGILMAKIKILIEELKPKNLELISDFLPQEKLRKAMQQCHLSLGQLSDHIRLDRTIPNKAYESLALKLPYLTAHNTGILELLTPDQTCLTCNPANAESLAEKIMWAKNNYHQTEIIAEHGYELYQNTLQSNVLAKNLMAKIKLLP